MAFRPHFPTKKRAPLYRAGPLSSNNKKELNSVTKDKTPPAAPSFKLVSIFLEATKSKARASWSPPPPTVNLFGSPFITWRGVPLIPSDKLLIRAARRKADACDWII